MRVGLVILPEHRWSEAAPIWREAEDMGFDHLWTYDHLAWRELADGPWFGTVPTLTAAAGVTHRARLGTFVTSPNYRHPVVLAKDLMTLDDVSRGRLLVGIGAGGTGVDALVLGGEVLAPRARVDRLEEFVTLLDLLLTQERTTWSGAHYTAVDARMIPGSVQQPRPPFVVAANGPRALRIAARFGQGWVTTGTTAPEDGEEAWWRGVAEVSAKLDLALREAGRTQIDRYLNLDASGVLALSSLEHARDAVGRAQELGFTDAVLHRPRPESTYAGDLRVLDAFASALLPNG